VTAIIGDSEATGSLWLLKLNKHGDVIWQKFLDSNCEFTRSFIKKDIDTYSLIYDVFNYDNSAFTTLLEFNPSGTILFAEKHNLSTGTYIPGEMLALNNGSYILVSVLLIKSKDYSNSKMLVQRFNTNHKLIWSDTLNLGTTIGLSTVFKTRDNKLVVGGTVVENSLGTQSFAYLMVLDTNGRKLNYNRFPYTSDSSENMNYIAQLKNGNLIVQTRDWAFDTYFTLADSEGNTIKRWETGNYPNGTGGFVPDGDSIMVFGEMSLIDGPLSLTKYDEDFNQIWSMNFDDTMGYSNFPAQILRTIDKGLLLIGTRENDQGSSYLEDWSDMVLIRLDSTEKFVPQKEDNSCGMVYPNPTTGLIHFSQPEAVTSLFLSIYDCHGKLIDTFLSTVKTAEDIDLSYLNNGLYFYRLYDASKLYCEGKFVKE